MKETNKWSVRDVITTVLLSAVLIVIQLVVNMVCMAFNPTCENYAGSNTDYTNFGSKNSCK